MPKKRRVLASALEPAMDPEGEEEEEEKEEQKKKNNQKKRKRGLKWKTTSLQAG